MNSSNESGLTSPTDRRALVVDDEGAVRQVICRWLQRRGWSVDQADGGQQALSLLGEPTSHGAAYELVICDLRMPATSGAELYRWMTLHRPDLASRFVLSSGDASDEETTRFARESGCPVLPKPFDLSDLATIVVKVAGHGVRAA